MGCSAGGDVTCLLVTVAMLAVLLVLVDHGHGGADRLLCLLSQMPPGSLSFISVLLSSFVTGKFSVTHSFGGELACNVSAMVAVGAQPWYDSELREEGPCEDTGNCKGVCFLVSSLMEL